MDSPVTDPDPTSAVRAANQPRPALTVGIVAFLLVVGAFLIPVGRQDRGPAGAAPGAGLDLTSVVSERPVDGTVQVAAGKVLSIAQVGNTVVFGGEFSEVGPARLGAAGIVDIATEKFAGAFPDIDGAVYTTVGDGAGGSFLGGEFASVGGAARSNLVRVDSAGSVTAFVANTNGPVYDLARAGATLYAAGAFTTLNDAPALRLAAVDASTGALRWDGRLGGTARAVITNASSVFAGGEFTTQDGITAKRLVALDSATGTRVAAFNAEANGTVRDLALIGTSLFAAGDFTKLNGVARTRVGSVGAVEGSLRPFNIGANNTVHALLHDAGANRLYLGGRFTSVGGASRLGVAAVDLGAPSLLTLSVAGLSGTVRTLELESPTSLVLGGTFTIQPERTQPATLARINLDTSAASAIVASAELPLSLTRPPRTESGVYALLGQAGSLLVAGDFSDSGTVTRRNLAAFDLTTRALVRSFAPDPDGVVDVVRSSADSQHVFVGGEFNTIAGGASSGIAKLAIGSGNRASGFTANADAFVKDMAVSPDGTALYAGGSFTTINGLARSNLAALNAITGAPLASFDLPLSDPTSDVSEGSVHALDLSPDGSRLMVIGNFRKIDGLDRPLVAQIDTTTAPTSVTSWRTQLFDTPCSSGNVGRMRDVDISPDGTALVIVSSGHYFYPACDAVNTFPMTPTGSNLAPFWTKKIGDTLESAVWTNDAIYIGGHFRWLEAETQTDTRFHIGAIHPSDGSPIAWDPSVSGFLGVKTLDIGAAGLFVGSDAPLAGGVPHGRVAWFRAPDPGLSVRKRASQSFVPAAGAPVTFTYAVENTTDASMSLTALTDSGYGSLDGRGGCALPITIVAGGTYSCAFTTPAAVDAAANPHRSTASATASSGPSSFDASTWHQLYRVDPLPTILMRVTATPVSSVPEPAGSVRFAFSVMNLHPSAPHTMNTLTDSLLGDLNGRGSCQLPVVIAPNGLYSCQASLDIAGAAGTQVARTFTATATGAGTTSTQTASWTHTLSAAPLTGTALLVVNDPTALGAGDSAIRARLESRGLDVTVADDNTLQAADTAGARIVAISGSADAAALVDRLVDVAVPVVIWNGALYDEFKLAPPAGSGTTSTSAMLVTRPQHALAGSRFGAWNLQKNERPLPWGQPAAGATTVATIGDNAALFSYEPGVNRIDGTPAPACRLAIPAGTSTPSGWFTETWTLFDIWTTYAYTNCGSMMVATIAGQNPNSSCCDGAVATQASVGQINDVVRDTAGNIYLADSANHRVRRIAAGTNVVTTFVGNGLARSTGDGGPATNATVNAPMGLAVAPNGDLYIAEYAGCRVRKVVAATNVITTVVGTKCGFGGEGGVGTAARVKNPYGLALDNGGNLYIADAGNQRIRRVNAANQIITTIAGAGYAGYTGDGGPATDARLNFPTGVTVASNGNIYIADLTNHRIRMVDAATRVITTIAGSGSGYAGDGGPATAAKFRNPYRVRVDGNGGLVIADYSNQRIRRIDIATNTVTTIAGTGTPGFSGDSGAATAAALNGPIAVFPYGAGNFLVSDYSNQRVRNVAGGTIGTIAGRDWFSMFGDGLAGVRAGIGAPLDIAIAPDGDTIIADGPNNRVRRLDAASGLINTIAGTGASESTGDGGPAEDAAIWTPSGVAVDPAGNIYIAENGSHRVRRIDAATNVISTIAGTGTPGFSGDGGAATAARVNRPVRVAVAPNGDVYVADQGNHRVRKIAGGAITTVAGNGTTAFAGNGTQATASGFNTPTGVLVAANGDLLFTEFNGHAVRRVVANGTVTTVAGTGASGFAGDGGPGANAQLNRPYDIAIGPDGDVWIADSLNARVRRVDSGTGQITTAAGSVSGFGDHRPATAALMNQPTALAFEAGGSLQVLDRGNGRIRRMG